MLHFGQLIKHQLGNKENRSIEQIHAKKQSYNAKKYDLNGALHDCYIKNYYRKNKKIVRSPKNIFSLLFNMIDTGHNIHNLSLML